MSPGVPWGQNCPGREALDLQVWLTFWVFSLCRFIKKLEHTWKALVHDGVSVMHSLTHLFICQATNVVIVFLGTDAKEPRDISLFLELLSSEVSL